MEIPNEYFVTGTRFEVTNCPVYSCEQCIVNKCSCLDVEQCVVKSHIVALSALVGVAMRSPGSAECIGARCCFDSFIVNREGGICK